MNIVAIAVIAALALSALVFTGRAIACARFNHALRSYVLPADRRAFLQSVPPAADGRRSA
jgi:hypothetical protein